MKKTKALMGTIATVEVADTSVNETDLDKIFNYFENVEERFSIFRETSEISLINSGKLKERQSSSEMQEIFDLAEKTKKETSGYFDILTPEGKYDPSGIVKGWSIYNASRMLAGMGFDNFYVDVGGDVQVHGKNGGGLYWSIGVKNPFNQDQIVKVVYLKNRGIATSGTYIRGQHIYNPFESNEILNKSAKKSMTEIVSLTVIGTDVCEADRFATAAFAMGANGIGFIENLKGFEGYLIDKNGIGTETSGFRNYCVYQNS
jgi:FAD:protein FMN transferase